jgi:predicted nucleotidyltransferase
MKSTYGVKKLALFGSSARRPRKQARDIDILVEFKDGCKTFDNYIELKFFLEDMFRKKIDLVIKDALRRELKSSIMAEAIYV